MHAFPRIALAATALVAVAAPPALAAPSARVSAPARAGAGQSFTVSVAVPGIDAVAGEVAVAVDGRAAEIGAGIPRPAGARMLAPPAGADPVARVGFYGARPDGAGGALIDILVTPRRAGTIAVRIGGIVVVDARGHRSAIRGGRVVRVRVGSAGAGHAAPALRRGAPGQVGRSADLSGDGRTTRVDLDDALYAWEIAQPATACVGLDAIGDATGDGCVDVADVQAVWTATRRAPLPPAATRTIAGTYTIPVASRIHTVNVTGDQADLDGVRPCDVDAATAGDQCSLRAAVQLANLAGADLIRFAIPGAGPHVIAPASRYQLSDSNTVIDGYTQAGATPNTIVLDRATGRVSDAVLKIQINGYPAPTGTDPQKNEIFSITGKGNLIQGIAFNNVGRGVVVRGAPASGNRVLGSWFGLSATGVVSSFAGKDGIEFNDAPGNRAGSGQPGDRNVIAGFFYGIDHLGVNTAGNVTQGNAFGYRPDGALAAQRCDGVDHNTGPKGNLLGGDAEGEGNLIAGAACDGVEYSHGWDPATHSFDVVWQVNDNRAAGNWIGFKSDGTYDAAYKVGRNNNLNDGSGINVIDGSNGNVIESNYLSGSLQAVAIWNPNTDRNVVRNNVIGLTPPASDPGPGGVLSPTTIASQATGGAAPNGQRGIYTRASSKSNVITGNVIANAPLQGVAVDCGSCDYNLISRNSFRDIGGLGIDLAPLGVVNANDVNDVDSGANQQLNFPTWRATATTPAVRFTAGTGLWEVRGLAAAGATVELYRSYGDPAGNGPGVDLLGTATAGLVGSGCTGCWRVDIPAAKLAAGDMLTALAIDASSNTSEFGPNITTPNADGTPATPNSRGAFFDAWDGFAGTALSAIATGTAPTTAGVRVGSLAAPQNRGDNHGTRVRALVTPPATGSYTFWIASDDNGVLQLSPTADRAGRVAIASVPSWTPAGSFDLFPQQKSVEIPLVAGQWYWIEAYAKEGGGGDNLEVAWAGPGLAARTIVSGAFLRPAPGATPGWEPTP